jgi:CRP-like cAMP-binding protein
MNIIDSKKVLQNSQLFQDLNDIHRDLILTVCEEINYCTGDIIFHQDDPGDALYIIARGEVEIVLEPSEPNTEIVSLASLGKDETFGETILIQEGQRTATARCHTDTQLLRLPRQRLVKLTEDYPEIGFRIMRRMAADLMSKLRTANLNIREKVFWRPAEPSGEPQ